MQTGRLASAATTVTRTTWLTCGTATALCTAGQLVCALGPELFRRIQENQAHLDAVAPIGIAAATGYRTSKEITRYTKAARQKVLARSAIGLTTQPEGE